MATGILHETLDMFSHEPSLMWRLLLIAEWLCIGAFLIGFVEGVAYWLIREAFGVVGLRLKVSRRHLTRRELDALARDRR